MRKIFKIFKMLFTDKTDNTLIQFFRSLFVGGIATVVDYSVFKILNNSIHTPYFYLIANIVGFIFGIIVNYLISIFWVFKTRNIQTKWIEILVFTVIGVIGLGLSELIIWSFKEYIGIDQQIGKLISVVIVYFWNFFARKILLYRGKKG